jgi:biotin operon repressor
LEHAVPEVAAAISMSRKAILSHQERVAENTERKLSQIHELIVGLTNGHFPLKIQGFATFGDSIPGPSADAHSISLQNNPALVAASLPSPIPSKAPAASAAPLSLPAFDSAHDFRAVPDIPPAYTMLDLRNVNDVWREWKYGISSHHSVQWLEENYQHKWRPGTQARTLFCRRKVIWDEVQRLIDSGLPEEEAVAKVEQLRNGQSLYKLQQLIRKSQENRAVERSRKRKGGETE